MRAAEMRIFAERARALLTLTPPSPKPQIVDWDGGRIVIAESIHCPDGFRLRETLIVRGDFTCGSNCVFAGAVFAAGNAQTGKGTRLDSIAAGGRVTLGPRTEVDYWALAESLLELRSGASIAGDAVSDAAIQLSLDAAAMSLFAPEIATAGRVAQLPDPEPVTGYLEIDPPSASRKPDLYMLPGYRDERLMPLGSDTWAYDGNLHFRTPIVLRSKLVVRGSFKCLAGSLLDDDIKTGGDLEVGGASICRGNLTARGDLTLGSDCLFEGDLNASVSLRLRSGVRGFRAGAPVEVTSAGPLILEPNVAVRGRVAGANAVRVEPAETQGALELLIAEA